MKLRYALSRTTNDRWPIEFQDTCERTACDKHGNSEGLITLFIRLDRAGYDLVNSFEKLEEILKKRKENT
jgi:hypothetical protein